MNPCPRCKQSELHDAQAIVLGPDDWRDDYTFRTFRCPSCTFVGAGYYEASRRGSGESWHHRGYEISQADFNRVNTDLAACPDLSNKYCNCTVHGRYGELKDGNHAAMRFVTTVGDWFDLG